MLKQEWSPVKYNCCYNSIAIKKFRFTSIRSVAGLSTIVKPGKSPSWSWGIIHSGNKESLCGRRPTKPLSIFPSPCSYSNCNTNANQQVFISRPVRNPIPVHVRSLMVKLSNIVNAILENIFIVASSAQFNMFLLTLTWMLPIVFSVMYVHTPLTSGQVPIEGVVDVKLLQKLYGLYPKCIRLEINLSKNTIIY